MESTAKKIERDDSRIAISTCKIVPITTEFSYRDHECQDAIWCEYADSCDKGKRCVDVCSSK